MVPRFTKKQQNRIDAHKLQTEVPDEKAEFRFLVDPFNNPPPPGRHFNGQLELILNLPEMKNLLNDCCQKLSRIATELRIEHQKLQSKKQFVVDNQFGSMPIPIEDILKKQIPKKLFRIFNIIVGGVNHITLTDKTEEEHIQELIAKSKNGEQTALSKQLRMFGYLYECQIVKEAQNEVLGLIETRVAINKFEVSDNTSSSNNIIESENFILQLGANEFDEEILVILAKEIEVLNYEIEDLERAVEIKSSLFEELKIDIKTLKNSIKKLEAEQTDENITKLEFLRKEKNWKALLKENNISRTKLEKVGLTTIWRLDVGFILEIQCPASEENLKGFDERNKKLTNLINEGGLKKLRAQIKELNADLLKVQRAIQHDLNKLKIIDEKYREQWHKQKKSTFGFGKSKVIIFEQECQNFRTEIKNKRLIRLHEVFSRSSLFSDEQRADAIESYVLIQSFYMPPLTPFKSPF